MAFKNNAPFISCISRIKNTRTGKAEDLDIVIPKYNLIQYGKKLFKKNRSLWNYYRDEPNSGVVGNINYSIKD